MQSALARHILLPLHERLLRRPTLAFLSQMRTSQWLSRKAIEELQSDRLRSLLHSALHHSPWHAGRIQASGIDLAARDLLAELRRLPTMDKAEAAAHRDAMVWRQAPGGAIPYSTGGSSGTPLRFYFGKRRQAADMASRFRAREWWGHRFGEPEVLLWGAPIELSRSDAVRTLRDRCFNQLMLNAFVMNPASMDGYLDAIEAWRPSCIYGYASSLSLLAAHVRSRRRILRLPSLKVVYTTGETLYPHQRQLIRETFAAPVANEYGCRDGGLIAMESPDGQMLLSSESVILEILDAVGREVSVGEVGEAVITNLCSEVQPFIRYRTGDLVRRSDAGCASGRGLHVLGDVMGRRTDFVVRPDGSLLHGLALIYVLRESPGVAEFKIIQHALEDFEVLVRPGEGWDVASRAAITRGIQARVGEAARVRVVSVESIEPDVSGKHRYVVSHVAMPRQLEILSAD